MALQLRKLNHHYANGRVALQEISFEIAPHERVAIIGPNGAGKSTLFYRLAGLLPGTAGQITVDEVDATHDAKSFGEKESLRSLIGLLFQNADDQLFSATVADDIAFGPLNLGWPIDTIRDESHRMMIEWKIEHLADRPPFQLSGGEKRRAALASILIMKPRYLLLDEPTTHLDPRGRKELVAQLRNLPCAQIIATHDLDFAKQSCQRCVVLDQGKLVADRPIDDVLNDHVLLETIF